MNSESSAHTCPQCGAAIPGDAPQGLCPRCILLGAATPTEAGRSNPGATAPSPEALRAAFPDLEILGLIGRGGMGFVYKARQSRLDRLVALKVLPTPPGADPHFTERFHREARALARLNHPGIVAVHDFGITAGFCHLVMEYVDGVNLRQAMRDGRFTPPAALAVIPRICEALQYAHEQGVLHRDIKPENILLDPHGRVKIADFGIAKLVDDDTPDLTLTLQGARLGTPTYMAPEQIEKPSEVDHRADIYSLGVVFYELLTGELPLGRFAPPSAKATLDARVDEIVLRALAKERELRQQTAAEVKSQVETVAANPAPPVSSASAAPPVAAPSSRKAVAGKVAALAAAWLVTVFLLPRCFPTLIRQSNHPDDLFWVGRLFHVAFSGVTALWAAAGMWLFRAEQRGSHPLPAPPRWAHGAALAMLAVALVSLGRAFLPHPTQQERTLILIVPGELALIAVSLAVWLRRHDWRLVATAALAAHSAMIALGAAFTGIWILRGGLRGPGAPELASAMPGVTTFIGAIALVVVGIWTLWHRELRRSAPADA